MSRRTRKSEIAPRKRQGIVHSNPKGYTTDFSGVSSIIGASAAFSALAFQKASPGLRALMGIGGTAAMGAGLMMANRDDPNLAMASWGMGAVAGTLTYAMVSKKSPQGIRALRDTLTRQGHAAGVEAMETAVAQARKNFPLLGNVISTEGLALAEGITTVPMAHSLMMKVMASEKRRTTDHGDVSFMPSWQDNQAGYVTPRRSMAPQHAPQPSQSANVSFSGQVRSHYNSSRAYEEL